jgi:CMP-N-acetylneuraminic acid synthetase
VAWKGLGVLAVVPARGGSKGIPRKNLCQVGGLSLIAHAARCARACPWVDRAVLSTDDEEMAEEGRRHGLEVPFFRPDELASDTAGSIGMWRHAWLASEAHFEERFELSVLLQPTTPLRSPDEVERTLAAVADGGHPAATTVARVPAHFTPEKILRLDAEGRVRPYLEDELKEGEPSAGSSRGKAGHRVGRQEIPPYYYLTGGCYAVGRETLIDRGEALPEGSVGVVIDHFVVNVDEPFELELARLLHDHGAAQERA